MDNGMVLLKKFLKNPKSIGSATLNSEFLSSNRMVFLKKFLKDPKSIGSVTPSSEYLSSKMMDNLPWNKMTSVAELGAGTGSFTRYAMNLKRPACKYLAVEQDREFQQMLKAEFPELIVADAAEDFIPTMHKNGIQSLDCIISGLPFANFDKHLQEQIIDEVYQSLSPKGIFVMFQYSLLMKSTLKKYFRDVEISFVLLNFPPAFVYYCRK